MFTFSACPESTKFYMVLHPVLTLHHVYCLFICRSPYFLYLAYYYVYYYYYVGRKTGDPFGNFTCFKWNGNSVLDYVISSDSIFDQISTLKIGDYTPLLSDHSSLLFDLEIKQHLPIERPLSPSESAPPKFIWSEESIENYTTALRSKETTIKLERLISQYL